MSDAQSPLTWEGRYRALRAAYDTNRAALMAAYKWQGRPGKDGGCHEVGPGGYECTLSASHQGLHEAWGTAGTEPIYVWGNVREEDPDGIYALNRMIDAALAEVEAEREGDLE